MADLDMSVQLDRLYLGLTPLELNDEIRYKIGAQFLGGSLEYDRTTATSPYMDGEVTISRKRQMVQEPAQVEIYGRRNRFSAMTLDAMQDNHQELIDAISQDNFILTVTIDDVTWQYQCEASGYTMAWTGPRMMARQGQMTIALRRQPNQIGS